jgi:hypothetical protein
VVVVRQPHDTTRFDAPLRAYRCGGGGGARGGLLVMGVNGGNGIAVWLRSPDTLASGAWTLLQRGDTVSARGALVAARFMLGDIAHGTTLDSGTVRVTRIDGRSGSGGAVAVLAHGMGIEAVLAQRLTLEATLDAVPIGADTVPCRTGP